MASPAPTTLPGSAAAPVAEDDRVGTSSEGQSRSWFKRALPRSLFGRALLIIVSPLILTQLIATWVFYDRHWETLSRRLAEGLAGDVQFVLYLWQTQPDWRSETVELATAAMRLRMTFKPGDRLARISSPADPNTFIEQTLLQVLQDRINVPFHLNVDYRDRDATIDIQLPDGVMYIVAPRQRLFSSTTYIFLLWMVGSSIILLVIASIFMRNQIRPVQRLAKAADLFGRGVDVPDFKPEGGIEVRRAAVAFNRMRERIRRQLQQRTEMLAGVSHDLRTPLTRMKLQLALFGDGPDVADLSADVAEMEGMIEAYLAFARGEGGEDSQRTDLARLLEDVVQAARRGGSEAEAAISLDAMPGLWLLCRPGALRRCFDNLVGNALRYGGRRVAVSAIAAADHMEIRVDDDGPGIPEAMREEVFRPFRRLEESRNRHTGGVGLGLTIARDVVRGHGGEIALDTSPLGGLRVRVKLPV